MVTKIEKMDRMLKFLVNEAITNRYFSEVKRTGRFTTKDGLNEYRKAEWEKILHG